MKEWRSLTAFAVTSEHIEKHQSLKSRLRAGFWDKFKSHLDMLGENRVLSAFVDNGFDTDSAIEKVFAFES